MRGESARNEFEYYIWEAMDFMEAKDSEFLKYKTHLKDYKDHPIWILDLIKECKQWGEWSGNRPQKRWKGLLKESKNV